MMCSAERLDAVERIKGLSVSKNELNKEIDLLHIGFVEAGS